MWWGPFCGVFGGHCADRVCGGGLVSIVLMFGGFPTGRLICFGLAFVETFIAWGCTPIEIRWGCCLGGWGFLGLLIFPWFPCRVGFLVGARAGLLSAGLFCAYSLAWSLLGHFAGAWVSSIV